MNDDDWKKHVTSQESTFELLFRTARRVNEYALSSLNEQTGLLLRPSHTALFPHITAQGVRPTAVAEQLGISKQAVGKRIDELVAMGSLEKVPDPTDGRAQLVRFKPDAIKDGLRHLNDIEKEFSRSVGKSKIAGMAETLNAMLAHLDQLESTD